ncbi:hypothetical protein UYO_1734 [Lachnospiraceae bacterium JC7]|nr:hypothetical protein UYO_1734 [Lachnospiraceae bacterium JC7]
MKKHRLLILADDLTGALDSGVQISLKGARVVILTNQSVAFPEDTSIDAIVIDTETRHVSPEKAAETVSRLVHEAKKRGINRIYKKTDSGLRGNVGSELAAVLEASGKDHLNFIPAYPAVDRKTIGGIQYVNGKPVAESIFANDPINPITVSRVDEIIHLSSDVPVTVSYSESLKKEGILVYDAETGEDLKRISQELLLQDDLDLTGGCAGFLEVFPMETEEENKTEKFIFSTLGKKLIVLSGSVNQITYDQLKYAEEHGAFRAHVPMNRILKNLWSDSEKEKFTDYLETEAGDRQVVIVDTLGEYDEALVTSPDEIAHVIASNMGQLARKLQETFPDRALMIIGGDTLQGFIRNKGVQMLSPIKEIDPGLVLSFYKTEHGRNYLITKSGAFGTVDQLTRVLEWLEKHAN